jgi:hypothetical protein
MLKHAIGITQHNFILPTHFGDRIKLATNTEYHSGILYVFFDDKDATNDPFDLKIKSSMQYVYQGFYHLE